MTTKFWLPRPDSRFAWPGAHSDRLLSLMVGLAIVCAIAIVQAPNLGGFWGRDDFAQLAVVRIIGSPWHFFTHDHYFVPHSIFRPLGYVSFWLCERLFGEAYAPHAAFDVGLHVAVALALWRFLVRASVTPIAAAAATLLFALHPAVTGPALWWSARFDVLATLFIVLALIAALRVCERASTARIAWACAAALAAMLSKETGMLAVVAISIVWLQRAAVDRAFRGSALVATSCAWLTAALFLAWRAAILGTFSSAVTGPLPLPQAIARGVANWFGQSPGYLTFWPHLLVYQRGALLASFIVAAAALVARAQSGGSVGGAVTRRVPIALVGTSLFVLPIVVQAPIAAFASPLSAGMSALEAGMQSRLYYLQLLGIAMIAAHVLRYVCESRRMQVRLPLAAGLAIVLTVLATTAFRDASAFAQRSTAIAAPAQAAVAMVSAMALPYSDCHVVFLGYAPAPEWSDSVSMDAVVKALAPDIRRIRYCWFHSDARTAVHLQAAPVSAADALPFVPATIDGKAIAWRQLGKLVFAYLAPLDSAQHPDVSHMKFLQFRKNQIVDVTADAVAGHLNYVLR